MIKLASPDISESDIQKAAEVLRSGNLVQGENVDRFERAIAEFTGISDVVVVSSCTAALHLALLTLDFHPGDAIMVPSFTFPATANVVERIGCEVVLCEVDPQRYIVTPGLLEKALANSKTKNIRGLIIVHEFGFPAQMREIFEIAKKFNLKLIEDAACAFGTMIDGKHVGYYGDIGCFSFHPRKAITTGEGGAIVTRNRAHANLLRKLRNHGIENQSGEMRFPYAGLNYRMTDFQAALGLGQLQRFPGELSRRKVLAKTYSERMSEFKEISLPQQHAGHSWQTFMVVLQDSIDRKSLMKKMLENDVQTNLGAQALNCLDYYQRKYGYSPADFPNASTLYQRGLALPIHGRLTPDDIETIVEALRRIILRAG